MQRYDGRWRNGRVCHKLSNFLLTYRNTPHSLTRQTPAELYLKREPHTRLSMLKLNLAKDVEEKQAQQKKFHDNKSGFREFLPGDHVLVQNFHGKEKWIPGVIIARIID